MKLCGVDTVAIAPGALVRWDLSSDATPTAVAVPPSENEKFHLDGLRRHGAAGWLALTVEFGERVPLEDLTRAVRTLLERHEVLRCHFDIDGDDFRRHVTPAATVTVEPRTCDTETSPISDHLIDEIAANCSPFTPFGHVIAAVDRPSSTTLICAFDHCFVDAYSLAVIASDLVDDIARVPVPAPASFLAIRALEENAAPVGTDDPRLTRWGEFLAAGDWTVPEFPLDLGLAPGEKAEVRTEVRDLLDAEATDSFESAVRAKGARTYPALLTAVADAVRQAGGPAELATILPIHTRGRPVDRRAVGWLVGNAPIRLLARGDGACALRTNTTRLGDALPLAEIGLTPVYTAYADLLRQNRNDVFMMSYVDYRRLHLPASVTTRQISSSRDTDTAQFWFWRDTDGIQLRARHPDTTTARQTMDDLLDAVTDQVDDMRTQPRRHRAG
ncbi:condensation protein [Gordonia sp. CPCC 206044]|uniref:condensation protein n=1 Tax=Gordonia sp. CPCC 206044 TaxID=3140793 RepID=UPI003AF35861